jgi:hypothetical protein
MANEHVERLEAIVCQFGELIGPVAAKEIDNAAAEIERLERFKAWVGKYISLRLVDDWEAREAADAARNIEPPVCPECNGTGMVTVTDTGPGFHEPARMMCACQRVLYVPPE